MPSDLLDKYFVRTKDDYQVIASLRQQIVFVRHNLMTDAPFTRMDLITCRNLLIYLQDNAKNKVLSLFHFALNAVGFLFLGSNESLGELEDEFEAVSKTWRLFRKLRDVQLASQKTIPPPTSFGKFGQKKIADVLISDRPTTRLSEPRLQEAYDSLLGRLLPAGFLVVNQLRLLHTFGKGGNFLVPQTGRHSDQLTAMIHSDLRAPVGAAVQHCIRDQKPVRYTGGKATLRPSLGHQSFTLTVDHFQREDGGTRYLLIAFEPAMTGSGRTDDIKKAMDSGFTDFLTKPVDVQQVNRVIAKLFG